MRINHEQICDKLQKRYPEIYNILNANDNVVAPGIEYQGLSDQGLYVYKIDVRGDLAFAVVIDVDNEDKWKACFVDARKRDEDIVTRTKREKLRDEHFAAFTAQRKEVQDKDNGIAGIQSAIDKLKNTAKQ